MLILHYLGLFLVVQHVQRRTVIDVDHARPEIRGRVDERDELVPAGIVDQRPDIDQITEKIPHTGAHQARNPSLGARPLRRSGVLVLSLSDRAA